LQLIKPGTRVMLTKKGISVMDMFDVPAFQAKYGIEPEQLIDLKGLMGDTSDNIPGVPGIGEKTATKLIVEYGSVENLIQNLDSVSGKKLQENLSKHIDLAILSKKLATIVCDMQLDFVPETFNLNPDSVKARELFINFEFKSLLAKMDTIFPGDGTNSAQPVEAIPQAVLLTAEDDIKNLTDQLRQVGQFAFYPVIVGQLPDAKLQGLAVVSPHETVYIAIEAAGWYLVKELLADKAVRKITHDVKMMYNVCKQMDILLQGVAFDTLLGAYLLNPTAAQYPLTTLKEQYLAEYSGWSSEKMPIDSAYACWSANAVHALYPVLATRLAEGGLDKLYYEIELPLVAVLAAMESYGIRVDGEYLKLMSIEIATKIELLLASIYQLAEEEFNVNSTKQLGCILFDKLKLPVIKKTKTGYSTDVEVLEKLAGQHAIIDKLLEYRLLAKLKSTYLDGLAAMIHHDTGRIYTTFNQMVTATGRLSSSEPNLQNIPVRSEIGRKIRELFVPDVGYDYIMSADYSQIELRVLAHMSADLNLLEAFNHNQDVHTRTAAEVFEVPMEEVTAQMRSRAKAVNFGIIYGISDYGLSRDIGVNRKEAAQYIDSYFAKYHGVKDFIDGIVRDARKNSYVTTLFGRRRYLPDIHSSNFNQRSFAERTAMNTPIQGTAADIIKKAMIDVHASLSEKKLRSRILLQVHDELLLEVVEAEKEVVAELVKQVMEQTVSLIVPMVVDVKMGKNWAEAK
ncbi:MAG TPA: DNA polymerase I, partial [Negativicutes bacterium]